MWEQILKAALESGLWATLFCALLVYLLRDARTREGKYRDTIDALVHSLKVLDEVSGKMEDALLLLRKREKRGRCREDAQPAVNCEAADV